MRLLTLATSPFGRKCHAAAIELGLADRIAIIETPPAGPDNPNPLARVPALILDDGGLLYDSRVICEYLDALAGGDRLFPADGAARWTALRLQALGDGIGDAAVARRGESLRPDGEKSPRALAKYAAETAAACDRLEDEVAALGDPAAAMPTIGALAVAAALAYLDLRFADEPWRPSRPRLAQWYAGFSSRRSWRSTAP